MKLLPCMVDDHISLVPVAKQPGFSAGCREFGRPEKPVMVLFGEKDCQIVFVRVSVQNIGEGAATRFMGLQEYYISLWNTSAKQRENKEINISFQIPVDFSRRSVTHV